MKITQIITEAMLFKDFHEFKLDPDRVDTGDLKDQLLPLIVKMAYTNLYHDKEKHEKKYAKSNDEDAYNFEFTSDALAEEIEKVLGDLAESLTAINDKEVKEAIKAVSKDFQEPLE